MSAPWMLVRLVLETRDHHARADADRLGLMDAATPTAYRRFLARIYGFEATVEERVEVTPGLGLHVFEPRKKAALLARDLEALGMTADEVRALPRCHVAIRSPAQALGWMFVVERLTLISKLIRRHLATTQPAILERASSYLDAYSDAGARFRSFGEDCCWYAQRSATAPTAMVLAASYAFELQRNWYARLRATPSTLPDAA